MQLVIRLSCLCLQLTLTLITYLLLTLISNSLQLLTNGFTVSSIPEPEVSQREQ